MELLPSYLLGDLFDGAAVLRQNLFGGHGSLAVWRPHTQPFRPVPGPENGAVQHLAEGPLFHDGQDERFLFLAVLPDQVLE